MAGNVAIRRDVKRRERAPTQDSIVLRAISFDLATRDVLMGNSIIGTMSTNVLFVCSYL